jgi:protein-S-isoprenylcysteine O-methyltransferase Ste14
MEEGITEVHAMTEPETSAGRPNRYPWPPIIYAAALLCAYVLERAFPLWPASFDLKWPGVVLTVTGVAVAVAGVFQFKSIGTNVDPTGEAKILATGGIYSFTRNPMYLGAVVSFVGLSLWLHSGWLLLLVPAIAITLQSLAIEREEHYLSRRFGAPYRDYCTKVRRWL